MLIHLNEEDKKMGKQLFVDVKEKNISGIGYGNSILVMERDPSNNVVTYKSNDKVLGICSNRIINKILFNNDEMSMYSWYCLNTLINHKLFIKTGEFKFHIPVGNPLGDYLLVCDKSLESIKIISKFNDIFGDRLRNNLSAKCFFDTCTNEVLNAVFDSLDATSVDDILYVNSLVIARFVYSYCISYNGTIKIPYYDFESYLEDYVNSKALKWISEKKRKAIKRNVSLSGVKPWY